MSELRMIFYDRTQISGTDLNRFEVGQNVNALISPDNLHVLRIESRRFANSTQLHIRNNQNVAFSANIVNADGDQIAQMFYNGHEAIIINHRWVITNALVQCRNLVLGAPVPDAIMNIRLHNDHFRRISQSRIDIQLNGGSFAAMAISSNSELFVRFNGNYVYNRWGLMIDRAIQQRIEDDFQRNQRANEGVDPRNLLVIEQEPNENVVADLVEQPFPEEDENGIDGQANDNALVIEQEPNENVADNIDIDEQADQYALVIEQEPNENVANNIDIDERADQNLLVVEQEPNENVVADLVEQPFPEEDENGIDGQANDNALVIEQEPNENVANNIDIDEQADQNALVLQEPNENFVADSAEQPNSD